MSPQRTPLHRRGFLKHAAACAAAPWVVPARAVGMDGAVAPSNRIALGHIGVGMMGRGHVRLCAAYPEAQVVAVCDVDRWRRQRAKDSVEQAYAAEQPGGTYRGCAAYNDLRELLARDDIDAVVIATGDNWQGLATCMAARSGKDVYCEKPVSLTVAESKAMVETVRRHGRVFQGGLQQRSSPEFRRACELVRRGAIGKLEIVYIGHPGANSDVSLPAEPVPDGLDWDLWLGAAPWRPFNSRFHHYGQPPRVVPWDFCRDFGGGNLTSNGVHAFDVVQWAVDMDHSGPVEIIPPESGQYPCLTYKYANGVLLQVINWRLNRAENFVPKGWDEKTPLQMFGAVYVGDRGWIHVGRQGYLKSYPEEILREGVGDADVRRVVNNHHLNWLDSIRTRRRAASDVGSATRSTIVSQLGCIAHWTRRALRWDPVQQVFPGDEEANRYLSRAMRPPWRL